MVRRRSQRTREGQALFAAALLHALSLTALRRFARFEPPAARPAIEAAPNEQQYDLEVSTAPLAEPSADPPYVASPSPASRRSFAVVVKPKAPSADAAVQEEAARPSADGLVTAEESPDVSAEDAPSPPIDLGVGPEGWRRWAVNPPFERSETAAARRREPLVQAPPKSRTGGLLEGLEAHDRAVGLSPSGRVRSALLGAAHSDVAPQLGVASFSVTLRNDGAVEVSLHGASADEPQWRQVAERAAQDLRKNPPRIPPPRTGVRVLVEIKAEAVMPNGLKAAQMHGARIEVEAPRIRSTAESQQAIKEKNPTADVPFEPGSKIPVITLDLPGVYLTHVGKVCSVRAGLTPLGLALSGGCDPANIRSKPSRMVHSRIREESLF